MIRRDAEVPEGLSGGRWFFCPYSSNGIQAASSAGKEFWNAESLDGRDPRSSVGIVANRMRDGLEQTF
jgi:hypothetical protein